MDEILGLEDPVPDDTFLGSRRPKIIYSNDEKIVRRQQRAARRVIKLKKRATASKLWKNIGVRDPTYERFLYLLNDIGLSKVGLATLLSIPRERVYSWTEEAPLWAHAYLEVLSVYIKANLFEVKGSITHAMREARKDVNDYIDGLKSARLEAKLTEQVSVRAVFKDNCWKFIAKQYDRDIAADWILDNQDSHRVEETALLAQQLINHVLKHVGVRYGQEQ